MSKKANRQRKESTKQAAQDYNGFFAEFDDETPRGKIILGAAFLDEQLHQMLANFFIDETEETEALIANDGNETPLSSFSARTQSAYCLGLISKDERDDLVLIRRIRNECAHRLHDLTYDDAFIEKWCRELTIPRKILRTSPEVKKRFGDLEARATNGDLVNFTIRLLIDHFAVLHSEIPQDRRVARQSEWDNI